MKQLILKSAFNCDEHVMIDLETLGKSPNAVISQISAVKFNPITKQILSEFDRNLDIQKQLDNGHEMDASTVQWWLTQSKEAQDIVYNNDKRSFDDPKIVLRDFSRWILPYKIKPWNKFNPHKHRSKKIHVWGNGPTFDLIKLRMLYKTFYKSEAPWYFFNETCMRTIVKFIPSLKRNHERIGIDHDGLSDSINQANIIMNIFDKMMEYDDN